MPICKSITFITNNTHFSRKPGIFKRTQLCKFSSGTGKKPVFGKSFQQPPLSQDLPGLPKPVYSSLKEEEQSTKVTTLPNGLKIASENRFGQFCTVGVLLNSGSRFEVAYPSGVSHFLEKLAFGSTQKFKSKDNILTELEQYGGICDCQSTRDTFIYAASADVRGLEPVMKVLADVVLRPTISDEEMEMAKQTLKFELENLNTKPEQEQILMDMIHTAAYRNNTLGLPKICPENNINLIDRKILFTFLKHHYTPDRIVVGGVGVDHDEFVDVVKKYFMDEKPIWETESGLIYNEVSYTPDSSVAQYTGGLVKEECDIPQYHGPSGLPELAHVVIGLEGTSHQDEDFVPLCVLNTMMGGGGSFSAGGPGKGMYTRLYTNVLQKYHWMFSATAYYHAYADSGIFCIHASSEPSYVGDIPEVIVKELVSMNKPIIKSELSRAKKQLQSMLLMNLEARPVVFEDMGRQVLATGYRKRPQVFIDAIENVSELDVIRVVRRLLSSRPCVAARGNNLSKLPSYEHIQSGLMHLSGQLPRTKSRLSLFH